MERCKVVVWLAGVWIIWDIVRGWGLGTCYRPLLRPVGVRFLPFVSFLWIGLDLGSGIGKWKWKLQKSVFSRRRIFVDMDFWYTGFLVLCYLSFFPCLAIAIYFIFQILLTLWQVVLPWYIKIRPGVARASHVEQIKQHFSVLCCSTIVLHTWKIQIFNLIDRYINWWIAEIPKQPNWPSQIVYAFSDIQSAPGF